MPTPETTPPAPVMPLERLQNTAIGMAKYCRIQASLAQTVPAIQAWVDAADDMERMLEFIKLMQTIYKQINHTTYATDTQV